MAVRASARTVPGQPSNDHGWERQGRRSLRKFPTLALAGPDDANKRGVWVPTTSVEQYGASLATWFGLTPDQLTQVFPNLPNFKTPPSFRLRAPWLVLLLYSVSVAIAGLALKGADLLKQMNHLCRSLL